MAYQYAVVEKDDIDMFSNPSVLPLLDRLGIDDCFVYGVFTEFCVKAAILGLLKTGRKVSLVTEATAHLSQTEGERVVADFLAAGGLCVICSLAWLRADTRTRDEPLRLPLSRTGCG